MSDQLIEIIEKKKKQLRDKCKKCRTESLQDLQAVYNLVKDLLEGQKYATVSHPGFDHYVYRLRNNRDLPQGEKYFSSVREFWSPETVNARRNRLNWPEFPVLYCSANLETCLSEGEVKDGDIVSICKWKFLDLNSTLSVIRTINMGFDSKAVFPFPVTKDKFEKECLDFDALLPKLIKKGYLTNAHYVNPQFVMLDEEFKSWFEQYGDEEFEKIEDMLKQSRIKWGEHRRKILKRVNRDSQVNELLDDFLLPIFRKKGKGYYNISAAVGKLFLYHPKGGSVDAIVYPSVKCDGKEPSVNWAFSPKFAKDNMIPVEFNKYIIKQAKPIPIATAQYNETALLLDTRIEWHEKNNL